MTAMRNFPRAGIMGAVAMILVAPGMAAQARPTGRVDGRIQGAQTEQVSRVEMNPRAVQVINLHPFRHMDIILPYAPEWVNGGDSEVFSVTQKDNVLSLAALNLKRTETSMSIRLTDPQRTVLSFLVRTDSMTPMVYKLEIVDPQMQVHRAMETEIASRMAAEFDARVARMADLQFQQMLLFSGALRNLDRKATDGGGNDRIEVEVLTAQTVPNLDGGPAQLHIRYAIQNRSLSEIDDGFFRLYIQREKSAALSRSQKSPLYDIRDVRTSDVIPAMGAVRGILILDMPTMSDRDALHLEFVLKGGHRVLRIDRLMVGAPEAPHPIPLGGQ